MSCAVLWHFRRAVTNSTKQESHNSINAANNSNSCWFPDVTKMTAAASLSAPVGIACWTHFVRLCWMSPIERDACALRWRFISFRSHAHAHLNQHICFHLFAIIIFWSDIRLAEIVKSQVEHYEELCFGAKSMCNSAIVLKNVHITFFDKPCIFLGCSMEILK